ncbi:hypothetical protein BaRGS_00016010 [Batillaria attramentaria]|uniref:Uncharacterized protein n=1 Tax=Batillaria attramentaria TaxID=370345 RepID=A0ABD0L020_9CAEN
MEGVRQGGGEERTQSTAQTKPPPLPRVRQYVQRDTFSQGERCSGIHDRKEQWNSLCLDSTVTDFVSTFAQFGLLRFLPYGAASWGYQLDKFETPDRFTVKFN